jgi:hypothetical protein
MKGNFKATEALALLTTNAITTEKGSAAKWSKLVAEQLNEIERAERMTPRRAVAVGLMLHAVKASLKHGEFTPWLKQTLTALKFGTLGTAQVKASYYMRLALAFVDQAKPSRPELAALPAGGLVLDLEAATGPAAKLIKRLDEFCGECSLQELLEEHGIKSGGGGGSSRGAIDVTSAPAGEDPLLADTASYIMGLRSIFCTPDTFKRLPAAQRKDAIQQLASILDEARQLDAAAR